jgi:hypothetical protein
MDIRDVLCSLGASPDLLSPAARYILDVGVE